MHEEWKKGSEGCSTSICPLLSLRPLRRTSKSALVSHGVKRRSANASIHCCLSGVGGRTKRAGIRWVSSGGAPGCLEKTEVQERFSFLAMVSAEFFVRYCLVYFRD